MSFRVTDEDVSVVIAIRKLLLQVCTKEGLTVEKPVREERVVFYSASVNGTKLVLVLIIHSVL